jgi:hypothetical protein
MMTKTVKRKAKNQNRIIRKPRKKRGRRTYRDIFLEKLAEMVGGEQTLIGNLSLREALGWDEAKYIRVKRDLIESRAIISGRGKGGSVALAKAPGTQALKVFVSYSHADELLKSELLKHLEPLRRLGLIESWHDRKLKPGQEWDKVISANLNNADIILILVSVDFVNSEYCYDIELEKALERHASGTAKVIPVILRNCLWEHTSFAKLQALPPEGKAVCSWQDRDEAFVRVAQGIRQVADELLESK